MNNLSSSVNSKNKNNNNNNNNNNNTSSGLEWRRSKVQELSSKGNSQREIAQILQVSNGTVNRDLSFLRQQVKTNIKRYIDERLPEEYEKCLVGLTAITKEAWITAQNTEDKREKIQALSLAKECYSMKLDLLTNATVVDDAIRFVSDKSKDKERLKASSSNNSDEHQNEESKEPDYNEDRDQLEEEQEQGEQMREISSSSTTTNQIF
jgi:predicted transcriptional regulator